LKELAEGDVRPILNRSVLTLFRGGFPKMKYRHWLYGEIEIEEGQEIPFDINVVAWGGFPQEIRITYGGSILFVLWLAGLIYL
jgi:hypothetical protein